MIPDLPQRLLRRRCVRREHLISFYDIFVKNAFSNFEDLLKEVTYNPLMATFLTYNGNMAYHRRKTYPDENYAREDLVMQLFTLGLWQLNPDGTNKLDSQGQPLPTYDNSNIVTFARVWTGFSGVPGRGNVEIHRGRNAVDPLTLLRENRDYFPKKDGILATTTRCAPTTQTRCSCAKAPSMCTSVTS